MHLVVYHQNARTVARARTSPAPRPIGVQTPTFGTFESGLAYVARRLLFSGAQLSENERQLLSDLARSEARYPMKTLQQLIAIAPRCPEPHDREVLAEFIRERILAQCAPIGCPIAAFEVETRAQGVADLWQFRYARNPTAATREQVIQALRQQEAATRFATDAVITAG